MCVFLFLDGETVFSDQVEKHLILIEDAFFALKAEEESEVRCLSDTEEPSEI